jgi:hypothetical protein
MKKIEQERAFKKIKELQQTIKKIKTRSEAQVKLLDKKQDTIVLNLERGFRKTEITDEVLRLRKKVLDHPEFNFLLEKYHTRIDDVALVSFHESDSGGYFYEGEFKLRRWNDVSRFYLYGGREDSTQILFRPTKNGRYVLTGFQFKFPEKQKRDWKATFKEKAA